MLNLPYHIWLKWKSSLSTHPDVLSPEDFDEKSKAKIIACMIGTALACTLLTLSARYPSLQVG